MEVSHPSRGVGVSKLSIGRRLQLTEEVVGLIDHWAAGWLWSRRVIEYYHFMILLILTYVRPLWSVYEIVYKSLYESVYDTA